MEHLSSYKKIVTGLKPQDINGGAWNSDVFNMKLYKHMTFIVEQGAWAGGTSTMKVQACDDVTPSNTTDMAFNVRQAVMDGTTDALGALTAVAATGLALDTANTMTVIEVDVDEVMKATSGAYTYIRLTGTDPGAADLLSVLAVLGEPRYGGSVPATAIV